MPKFNHDMYKMPDKVEAVLDVIQKEMLEILRQQIRATESTVVFLSRPAVPATSTPPALERFVWKYLKEVADVIIEEGAAMDFHIDSNWERDLDFFKAMPKGKCVFQTDGVTNIYKIKEKLGDRMCIMGDVGAVMLTLGTPDEVYNYSSKLIKDIGPGLILSTGCSAPPNAKVENVKAMIAAAQNN